MILEVASLMIRPGGQAAFEAAFEKAQRLIVGIDGYLSHELQRSIEHEHHYTLLIEWRSLEAPTLGFRKSPGFLRWRELLQEHLEVPPSIEHFQAVAAPARAFRPD